MQRCNIARRRRGGSHQRTLLIASPAPNQYPATSPAAHAPTNTAISGMARQTIARSTRFRRLRDTVRQNSSGGNANAAAPYAERRSRLAARDTSTGVTSGVQETLGKVLSDRVVLSMADHDFRDGRRA